MAYWAGYTPTNRIVLAGGELEEIGEDLLLTGTVTYCIPGAIVCTESAVDSGCVIAEYNGAKPIGFIGYEKCPILIRPTGTSALTTAYAQYDRIFVHQGVGVVFSAMLSDESGSLAVVKGDPLYVAAHGRVTRPGDVAGRYMVGIALETTSTASTPKRLKMIWSPGQIGAT
jgi:hypothetical protein